MLSAFAVVKYLLETIFLRAAAPRVAPRSNGRANVDEAIMTSDEQIRGTEEVKKVNFDAGFSLKVGFSSSLSGASDPPRGNH
jgi:hypothetical protein